MAKRDSRGRNVIGRLFSVLWKLVVAVYAVITLLALLVVPVAMYFLFAGGQQVKVGEDIALVWAPAGTLVVKDQPSVPDALLQEVVAGPSSESLVRDLVEALERAAQDPRISLAFLKLDELTAASAGVLEELAAAIDAFKASGKKVVAWSPSYTQAQYRLAAHAGKVYLDPMGFVFLDGFGLYRMYFAEALDKLGVKIHVFRVGEYKSFVEPFIRNDMSPAARAAARAWLGSLWQAYLQGVGAAQAMEPAALATYVNRLDEALVAAGGDAAEVALDAGLVDELVTVEDLRDDMRALVGTDPDHGSFRQISHVDYLAATQAAQPLPRTDSRIGMVVVDGPIVMGESVRDAAGAETIARLIARARADDHISALVLRVNSPGGSVFASERIRREVALTRAAGKPVVASFASVAASGGYWISMNADQIWANPSTITGSIGVFGIVPGIGQSLEKIGVHTDGLGTTPLSGAMRLTVPMSEAFARILQSGVENVYEQFVAQVAAARGMSVGAVEAIAQGRVWSGLDASRIGLVDELGGLDGAIAAAAELAGLQPGDYALDVIRPAPNWRALLLQFLSPLGYSPLGQAGALLPDWIGRVAAAEPAFSWLRHGLRDPRGVYAHCFCQLR